MFSINGLLVLLGSLVFSFFDFLCYNVVNKNSPAPVTVYRYIQIGVQVLISWPLFIVGGWIAVAGFWLAWWFWLDDILYYVIAEVTNGFGIAFLPGRGSYKEIFNDQVVWAGWTCFGLLQWVVTKKLNRPIEWELLLLQAILGVITLWFVL